MRLLTRSLAAAAAIGMCGVVLPTMNAQAQAPQPPASAQPQTPQASPAPQSPAPGPSNPSHAIPDEKLDAEAAAIKQVLSLQQNYQERMAAADESEQKGIQNDAVNAVTKAITDQGLSVEEYTSILEVAQNDPDVRQKILQRIRPTGD